MLCNNYEQNSKVVTQTSWYACLLQPVFSNGQLYVAISWVFFFKQSAISWVTSKNDMKILLIDEDSLCVDSTSNALFKEIFQNV